MIHRFQKAFFEAVAEAPGAAWRMAHASRATCSPGTRLHGRTTDRVNVLDVHVSNPKDAYRHPGFHAIGNDYMNAIASMRLHRSHDSGHECMRRMQYGGAQQPHTSMLNVMLVGWLRLLVASERKLSHSGAKNACHAARPARRCIKPAATCRIRLPRIERFKCPQKKKRIYPKASSNGRKSTAQRLKSAPKPRHQAMFMQQSKRSLSASQKLNVPSTCRPSRPAQIAKSAR